MGNNLGYYIKQNVFHGKISTNQSRVTTNSWKLLESDYSWKTGK